jgi:hypothetical protein
MMMDDAWVNNEGLRQAQAEERIEHHAQAEERIKRHAELVEALNVSSFFYHRSNNRKNTTLRLFYTNTRPKIKFFYYISLLVSKRIGDDWMPVMVFT